MTPAGYVELDVTTNFSFLRGASHPGELVHRAAELGYAAVGVSDVNSVAGMVRAHQAAKEAGIRLCAGARLRLADAPDVLVWVENRAGWANLCRLLTEGKRRAEKGDCLLHLRDVLGSCGGLSAALAVQGIDPHLANPTLAALESAAGPLKEALGDRLSLAVARLYAPADAAALERVQHVRAAHGVPLLAVNQVHYHQEDRRMLQDVLTCVRHGCTIQEAGLRLFANAERFLKSPREMEQLFGDLPGALERAGEIAGRCAFCLDELRYEYPDEVAPAGHTAGSYLAQLAWSGAAERYPGGLPDKVRRQIEHELALIAQLKIEAYFLTVYDLVRFARSRGILCQGRGSAANSAVCYCLGVTSVDPARIDVLFERFVSAARGEPPDIDIDFEHERREEVIQYVYEKYGRDRAAMTAEVITYRGRSAVRDVGKAMGLGLDVVDLLAKQLEGWRAGAASQAQLRAAGLDPTDATLRMVVGLTGQLLGFPRHLSQHVGGMVMTRGPLCELVPIENAAMPGRSVIEWDKDDIDALGILKVDVLALGMLTAIAKAMKLVNEHCQLPIADCRLELHTIPPEDPAVYDMVSEADTVGVFQIESRAQMSMLPRLRPRCFYDLVIEVAIVRPGPIQGDMVHPYLRRREGLEAVHFPKPELEAVLGKTLGVPLFQEQAMKMVMVAAGFSAEEADRLRRAMAAWRYNGHIDLFHQKIVQGMLANGYDLEFAERCFHQIQGFGEYGFPESHAASFALLVYASAWLKHHHPAAFCCALLNSQPMGFYAPAQLVRDAREHGVRVLGVDVNHSDYDCTLQDPLSLRLGLRMIKGLAASHARRIVEARSAGGLFRSIDHLHAATGLSPSAIAKLCQAGACDAISGSRRAALWDALALPSERPPLALAAPQASAALPPMSAAQEVEADYGTVGLSLRGHPLEFLRGALDARKIVAAARVRDLGEGDKVSVAGLVLVRQRPGAAEGVVFETLEDETGIVNLIIYPSVYEHYRPAARGAALLQADGRVQRQGKVLHIIVSRLHDLSHLLGGYALFSRDFH